MTRHDDAPVVIWTNRGCPACVKAKQFFERKQAVFAERRLKSDPTIQRAFALATGGARSVPQIFIGETHVGGFDDLLVQERQGNVDVLLGRAAPLPKPSLLQRWFGGLGKGR
jgi:glutaredoxin 3